MSLFYCHIVKPSIDIEPGQGLKHQYLNQLIDFLASEEGTSQTDLDLIRQIETGKLQRHPALHGVACPNIFIYLLRFFPLALVFELCIVGVGL